MLFLHTFGNYEMDSIVILNPDCLQVVCIFQDLTCPRFKNNELPLKMSFISVGEGLASIFSEIAYLTSNTVARAFVCSSRLVSEP